MVLNPDFLEMAGNEIFPNVEFGDVFPRISLQTALEPLKAKTGVDFFKFHRAFFKVPLSTDVDYRQRAPGETREILHSNLDEFPEISHYFDPNYKRRLYFRYLDREHNPEKTNPLDYLMMTELIRDCVQVFTIFSLPTPDDPFWKKFDVGKTGKIKFDYLKVKGAFLVLFDLEDPLGVMGYRPEAIEITAPLFATSSPKDVGFLASKQDDPTAQKFDAVITSKSFLIKDRSPVSLDLLATEFLVGDTLTEKMKRDFLAVVPDLRVAIPQGETQMKFLGSVWAQITNAAALQYLLTNNLIHKDPLRGPAEVKKFGELFFSSCGFFLGRTG